MSLKAPTSFAIGRILVSDDPPMKTSFRMCVSEHIPYVLEGQVQLYSGFSTRSNSEIWQAACFNVSKLYSS